MKDIFINVAANAGWTPTTQVGVLLDFIEEYSLEENFKLALERRLEEEHQYENNECPDCAEDIPIESDECANCGHVFPEPVGEERFNAVVKKLDLRIYENIGALDADGIIDLAAILFGETDDEVKEVRGG